MAPTWASASTISTPGRVGRPGKCPAKNASSPVRCQRPAADRPGTTSTSSSTNRNGGRCGRTSTGAGRSGNGLEQVGRGVLRADLRPGLLDLPLLVHEERGADDPQVLLAVHRLLTPGAVRLGDGVVLVGEQWEPEPVLLVEFGLLGGLVGADAEHGRVADVAEDVAHAARLRRAPGRVGLRVEEHEDL